MFRNAYVRSREFNGDLDRKMQAQRGGRSAVFR